MERELNEALNQLYPSDRVGTGHDTETPYILYSYSETPYKIGFRASVTFYIIAKSEFDANKMFKEIQSIFDNTLLGSYVIRNVDYTKPHLNHLPDDRYMQEVSALITFEEA